MTAPQQSKYRGAKLGCCRSCVYVCFAWLNVSVVLLAVFVWFLHRNANIEFDISQYVLENDPRPPMTPITETSSSEDDWQLLIDGPEVFDTLTELIRGAKRSIVLHMFIWRDDSLGNSIARELLHAANDRGVKIRIVKDGVGASLEKAEEQKQTLFHKEFDFFYDFVIAKIYSAPWFWYSPTMANRSVLNSWPQEVDPNPLAEELLSHENVEILKDEKLHDHSKIWVFDGEILVMGGMNIEERYLTHDIKGRKYSDYMVLIRNTPGVVDAFWGRFRGKTRRLRFGDESSRINFVFNPMADDLAGVEEFSFETKVAFLELLGMAKTEIVVTMAYWADLDIVNALIDAAVTRSVDVRIFLPADANTGHHGNMKTIARLLRIHEEKSNKSQEQQKNGSEKSLRKMKVVGTKTMLHGKALLVDRRYLWVGSANFNHLTMKKLKEASIVLDLESEDHPMVSKMLKKVESLEKTGTVFRSGENVSYCWFCSVCEDTVPNLT